MLIPKTQQEPVRHAFPSRTSLARVGVRGPAVGTVRRRDGFLAGPSETAQPVQSRSASAVHELITRSTGTPVSIARSQPFPCQSS
jgi:hypothetical protein